MANSLPYAKGQGPLSPWALMSQRSGQMPPTQADIGEAADPSMSAGISQEMAGLPTISVGGPREFSENKVTGRNDALSKTIADTYLSPEDYNSLIMAAGSVQPIQEQKQHLQGLEDLNQQSLAALPNQKDLSPLLGLVDTYTGSHLQHGYQKPMSPEERANVLMQYGEKTKKGREDLLKDILKSAQYMKSGTTMDQAAQQILGTSILGSKVSPRPMSGNPNFAPEKYIVEGTKKINEDFIAKNNAYNTMEAAYKSGDMDAVRRSLGEAARAFAGERNGRLSNEDIKRVLPNTVGQDLASAFAYISDNPSVKLDYKIVQGLMDEVSRGRARLNSDKNSQLRAFKNSVKATNSMGGLSVDRIMAPAEQNVNAAPPQDIFDSILHRFLAPSKK